MRKNFSQSKATNCHIMPYAIGRKKTITEIYVSEGTPDHKKGLIENWNFGNKSSSLLPPKLVKETHPWLQFDKRQEVQVKTINEVCCEHNFQHIDFIHLDVQGVELDVLFGAQEMLANITLIWLEVENLELYDSQPVKKDIEAFFKKNEFTKIKDTVGPVSGDQLYVNNKSLK